MLQQLHTRQIVDAPIERVWDFFSRPDNLNLLTPPELHFRILSGDDREMHNGQIISYAIRILPLVRVGWVTEIKHVVPLTSFVDEQRIGPYRLWHHTHEFREVDGGVEISDTVHYALHFGVLGSVVHWLWVRRRLDFIFEYRQKRMLELLSSITQSRND